MAKLNINLDESLKRYVDEQIARGQYESADDLIADLLRDRANRGESISYSAQRDFGDDDPDALRKLIEQGIDSGPAQPWSSENFDAIRRKVQSKQRHQAPGG